jgi:beta-lactamase class A
MLLAVPVAPPAAGAAPVPAVPAAATCTENPFTHGFADHVARRWPANRISAAVYDAATGCEYSFRPDLRLTTASVIKIEIMAAVLLRAQRAGRGLTQWEQDRIWPMITESANTPASELWYSVGGVPGMQAFERELGLTETVAAGPTWGLTTTSARDRNRVLRQVLLGEYGPLDATSRAIARSYMLKVVPSQRWGATAGVPAGYAVPLKNGFFDSTCCRWRINTSAVVERPNGSRYALTVLSDGWPSDRPGIEAVEFVSRVVNAAIAKPFGPFASVTQFVRRQHRDVLGRSPTFGEIYYGTQYVGDSTARSATLLATMVRSAELDRSGLFVLRLYLGSLGRLPTYEVYRQRRDRVALGLSTQEQQAQAIATSTELTGPGSMSNAQFVDLVYQRALGRSPDASGRAYWISRLDAGASRGSVLAFFTEAPVAQWERAAEVAVAATVLSMLGRPPTDTGFARWTARLESGTPLSTLTDAMFRLQEYRERFS